MAKADMKTAKTQGLVVVETLTFKKAFLWNGKSTARYVITCQLSLSSTRGLALVWSEFGHRSSKMEVTVPFNF